MQFEPSAQIKQLNKTKHSNRNRLGDQMFWVHPFSVSVRRPSRAGKVRSDVYLIFGNALFVLYYRTFFNAKWSNL